MEDKLVRPVLPACPFRAQDMMMKFQKLPQPQYRKRSSIIADFIVDQIRGNEYRAGMKLPSERTIAEQMGVSRPSVREAISALQIVGILDSRPGDGTYVSERIGFEDLSHQAIQVLETSDSPLELLQARKALEIGTTRMVIKIADKSDFERIQKAWQNKLTEGLKGNYDGYLDHASEFHMTIARATRNTVIERMTENLMQATQQPLWLSMRRTYYAGDPNRLKEMLDVHDRIVKAIQKRQTELAIEAIEEHFDILIRRTYHLTDEAAE
jgi:GntR family transcriptional repressor for pyruvate dehydrogenase complex